MPGPPEMLWILVVLFLLFGAKKLPELARSSGQALKEFKKATKEAMSDDEEPVRPAAQEAPRRMEAPVDSNTTSTSA